MVHMWHCGRLRSIRTFKSIFKIIWYNVYRKQSLIVGSSAPHIPLGFWHIEIWHLIQTFLIDTIARFWCRVCYQKQWSSPFSNVCPYLTRRTFWWSYKGISLMLNHVRLELHYCKCKYRDTGVVRLNTKEIPQTFGNVTKNLLL